MSAAAAADVAPLGRMLEVLALRTPPWQLGPRMGAHDLLIKMSTTVEGVFEAQGGARLRDERPHRHIRQHIRTESVHDAERRVDLASRIQMDCVLYQRL